VIRHIRPHLPHGWEYSGDDAGTADRIIASNTVVRHTYRVIVPESAEPTEPYFLRSAREGAMYSWRGVADSVRALPFEPADIGADVALHAGVDVAVARAAEFVVVDKAFGEVRRPLIIVPAAAVAVQPHVVAIPTGDVEARTIHVTVSAARDSMHGVARLDAPRGWNVSPASVNIALHHAGESQTLSFVVIPPSDATGKHVLRASFTSRGRVYDEGYAVIDYPHIRPRPLYRPADIHAAVFPVRIAPDLTVGYIEGAGDGGADALAQLGANVVQLDAAALANDDLSKYDAIVAGIRAYEVRPDLIANNARLLEYARNGGTVVIQYNKYELVDGDFMPYPATMSRPHGRVTDENAAVTLLEPQHPALSWPNRITTADFDSWVHERGLYYLATFDPRYQALLSMADPGDPPESGSLVVARVGSGWYVYTGLAFFRQLPEGVAGAYRLLANLVSLGQQAP
jgi:hypothetical protein